MWGQKIEIFQRERGVIKDNQNSLNAFQTYKSPYYLKILKIGGGQPPGGTIFLVSQLLILNFIVKTRALIFTL